MLDQDAMTLKLDYALREATYPQPFHSLKRCDPLIVGFKVGKKLGVLGHS